MRSNNIDPITKEELQSCPKKPLVRLEKPFIDPRGKIQPLVDRTMKSAVIIESIAGSIRANHYHKTDWHYCYVIFGAIEYYYRPTGSDSAPKILTVRANEMIFTPPMVDHAMKFSEDTSFLTLSRNPRDQKTYEADVVRVDMVSPEGIIAWKPDEKNK